MLAADDCISDIIPQLAIGHGHPDESVLVSDVHRGIFR
jgi:hypothetical protein